MRLDRVADRETQKRPHSRMEWGRFVWGTVPVSAVEGVG